MISPPIRAGILTALLGALLGLLILGGGGRLAMHAIARIGGGEGGFTLGGTATIVFLGTATGAVAGLVLFAARTVLGRWPPLPSLVFWSVVLVYALSKLDRRDPVVLGLFLPVALLFGVLLQVFSWRWRRGAPASQNGSRRQHRDE